MTEQVQCVLFLTRNKFKLIHHTAVPMAPNLNQLSNDAVFALVVAFLLFIVLFFMGPARRSNNDVAPKHHLNDHAARPPRDPDTPPL